jgi:hypothetical protein
VLLIEGNAVELLDGSDCLLGGLVFDKREPISSRD